MRKRRTNLPVDPHLANGEHINPGYNSSLTKCLSILTCLGTKGRNHVEPRVATTWSQQDSPYTGTKGHTIIAQGQGGPPITWQYGPSLWLWYHVEFFKSTGQEPHSINTDIIPNLVITTWKISQVWGFTTKGLGVSWNEIILFKLLFSFSSSRRGIQSIPNPLKLSLNNLSSNNFLFLAPTTNVKII